MKVCLVIIYNHNYERNIPILNRVYAGRFSKICHVMPFYRGGGGAIGVYESSYQYNGYIAQAASDFYSDEFDYYCFVADDMIINPTINEFNLSNALNIDKDDGFITACNVLSDQLFLSWYGWAVPAVLNILSSSNATEWRRFLPDVQEARRRFLSVGLDCRNLVNSGLVRFMTSSLRCNKSNPYKLLPTRFKALFAKIVVAFMRWSGINSLTKHKMDDDSLYPLAVAPGCADFFVIPQSAATEFFYCCGVFAAMRNFVEISIPTAMALTCSRIRTLTDTQFKSDPPGDDGRRISGELEGMYNRSYGELVKNFPTEYLYIHPIKLSKWRDFT